MRILPATETAFSCDCAIEISGFISQYVVDPANRAAAEAVAETATSAVATELDSRGLITTQSVSTSHSTPNIEITI